MTITWQLVRWKRPTQSFYNNRQICFTNWKQKFQQHISVQKLKWNSISRPTIISGYSFIFHSDSRLQSKMQRKCFPWRYSQNVERGMYLKSLTSSPKCIKIIHRYGHYISYTGFEELETDASYNSLQKPSIWY